MINKNFTYAVVGASNNKEKYGHIVMKDLMDGGYRVVPINPKESEVLGLKVYASLGEYKENIDVAVFVVPPAVTEKIVDEVVSLGIKNVWMQPGSESEKAIKKCEENRISYIQNACIMINKK